MEAAIYSTLRLKARDASGQHSLPLRAVRADATVQELVSGLTQRLGLPAKNSNGMPQSYHAFLERDGRHLRSSESVGDVLQDNDEIILHPDVQAGGRP